MLLRQVGSQHIKAAAELRKHQMIGITLRKGRAKRQKRYGRMTCVILESYRLCEGSAESNDEGIGQSLILRTFCLLRASGWNAEKHFPVTFCWFHHNVFKKKKKTQQNKNMNVSENKKKKWHLEYYVAFGHISPKGQQTLREKCDIRKRKTWTFKSFLASYIFLHSLQNKGHRSRSRVVRRLYLMF